MFSNFVTFTEVVKLSQNVFYNLRNVNYSDDIFEKIFIGRNVETAESLINLIEDERKIIIYLSRQMFCIFDRRETDLIFTLIVKSNFDVQLLHEMFLYKICIYGYLHIIKYLIENGHKFHIENFYALSYSARNGHLEVVKYLVENGADISGNYCDAFIVAATCGHLEIVKYFVSKGINIHFLDEEALRSASEDGRLEVVKYLVECGADTSIHNWNALSGAKRNGHSSTIDYLESIKKKLLNVQ